MLASMDESGDTGFKIGHGSTDLFTIALVLFEENEEAQAADDRIAALRSEIGKPISFEFHFQDNSDRVREQFLRAVAPSNFFYFGFTVNKARVAGDVFPTKEQFYRYVCGLVFEVAKPHLDGAIVKIDRSGPRTFRNELLLYLRRKMNEEGPEGIARKRIRKVQAVDSRGNNLAQLADMVCGAVARSARTDRPDAHKYRDIIKHREISVRTWPE